MNNLLNKCAHLYCMTNITLSINKKTYEKMKKYSHIKWSEFVRQSIDNYIEKLDKINIEEDETLICMLAAENSLKDVWDNEADERWNNV
jgi:hypothetical protein